MNIPGSNLLDMALTIINGVYVDYYKFISRSLNVVGQDISTYDNPVSIYGSWQPVPRSLYEKYGLDLNKTYITFYTKNTIVDIQRGVSGDQIVFNGNRYQVESENEWTPIDGWTGVLICLLQGDPNPIKK